MTQDLTGWLTKQQAADAIGVSTKTIEQFAKDGKLQQGTWRRDGRGARVAVYHPADVDRLRQERQPEAAAFVLPATAAPGRNGHEPSPAAALAPILAGPDLVRTFLETIARAASQKSEKLFLTVDEAAAVTGLPRSYLRRLIREGTLEATRTRPRLVRRRDLETI